MKFGVVVFPGSNCDNDMLHVLNNVFNVEAYSLWHKDSDISKFSTKDCIILPGGFSYGDYLRTGAIAKFSNIMESIIDFANRGGNVFGICNGFQILCESNLLPGVLLRNSNQKYYCNNIYINVNNSNSKITSEVTNKTLKIPVAHAEGRYYCNESTLEELKNNNQILFNYCDENGNVNKESNFNGSIHNIAGIMNKRGNVFGMMPHPERACENDLNNCDGFNIIKSLLSE